MGNRIGVLVMSVVGAAAIALAVVGATRGDAGRTAMRADTPSYAVDLALDRTAAGGWAFAIGVADAAARPVAAESVTVVATMPDMGHLSPPMRAVAEGAGRFRAEGAPFFMTGRWDLDVAIREDGRTETARFAFTVDASS